MLDANRILTLRDLALNYLPKLRELRDRNARFGPFAAEQTLDSGWRNAWLAPLATGVERQAAQLLAQIYMHPETALISHWGWKKGMDPESIAEAEKTLALMRERRAETESDMLNEAKKLCELAGAPLPPWMNSLPAAMETSKEDVSSEVSTHRQVWTAEKLLALLTEYKELKSSGYPAFTKHLAQKYGVSGTAIRERLKQARALAENKSSTRDRATYVDQLWVK